MKKTLLAVAITAASFTAVADLQVSGHANLKAGFLEDFNGNEDITVGKASTSESRFRMISSTEANGVTYGAKLEFGLGGPGPQEKSLNKRVNEVTAGGSLGKLSLGQGSSAGDGSSEEDFSGTYLTAGDFGSWELGDDVDDNGQKDIGRIERIRYDAPMLGHLALSASINDADANDEGNDIAVAARYKLSNFAAHVAMISAEADDADVVAASVAGKMAGFTAALGFYTSENAGDDFEQTQVILGYNPGPFSISVDYQITETDSDSIEAETAGLNFVYRPTKGVELYAGARNAQADDGDIDEDAFLMGARVKF